MCDFFVTNMTSDIFWSKFLVVICSAVIKIMKWWEYAVLFGFIQPMWSDVHCSMGDTNKRNDVIKRDISFISLLIVTPVGILLKSFKRQIKILFIEIFQKANKKYYSSIYLKLKLHVNVILDSIHYLSLPPPLSWRHIHSVSLMI